MTLEQMRNHPGDTWSAMPQPMYEFTPGDTPRGIVRWCLEWCGGGPQFALLLRVGRRLAEA